MIGVALRSSLASGYTAAKLRADVLAGLAVGVLAIPLAMALAIACGVPPQHGLYTSIVAGACCAAFGGSRLSVSGPTAAFVVLLAPVAARHGLGGLAFASLLAGGILIALGVGRVGRLIQFIPFPVTTGFTAGIAVVIATLQLKDFFGITLARTDAHFIGQVAELSRAASTARAGDTLIGTFTLVLLVVCAKRVKSVPAPLIAIPLAALLAFGLKHLDGAFDAATIGSRFTYLAGDGALRSGIPSLPPAIVWPWELPNAGGNPIGLSLSMVRELLGPAFTIALLGAIESLLCAVVADGMAGTRHDPDGELIGQGIGNVAASFFGGFAATGAIARTATNVRAGATSPIAAIVHSGFVLASLLALGPLLAFVPMASLAALLLKAAWNMSDARHVVRVLRIAPRSDRAVLLTCLALTVLFDMVVAVTVGVVLAALLFMRRMVDFTNSRLLEQGSPSLEHQLPEDVLLYEIGGPLFFGAAEKCIAALGRIHRKYRRVILDLSAVPVMDVSGAVALESAIAGLNRAGVEVVIAEAVGQPRELVERALGGRVRFRFAASVREAVESSAPG